MKDSHATPQVNPWKLRNQHFNVSRRQSATKMMKAFFEIAWIWAALVVFSRGKSAIQKVNCALTCKQWNGLLDQSKGLQRNLWEMLSLKSDKQAIGCDCEALARTNVLQRHRKSRSIDNDKRMTVNSPRNVTNKSTVESISRKRDRFWMDNCYDPPDRSTNRTWKARNLTHFRCNNESVYFMSNGSINITWPPHKDQHNVYGGYIVVWSLGGGKLNCYEVINKTYLLLGPSDGVSDEYINPVTTAIFSLPGFLDIPPNNRTFASEYHHKTFTYIPYTFPRKNTAAAMWGAYVSGCLGASLLVLLIAFIRHKRKTCRTSSEGFGVNPLQQHSSSEDVIQVNAPKRILQNDDTFFASYLPESEEFSDKVAKAAYDLGKKGYKVVFDQIDSVQINEIGFNMWVDKQILEAKKFIVFCSPGYVRLWQSLATNTQDSRLGHVKTENLVRVRYEIKRISDVYSENCSTSRIVCIKMDPKMTTRQLPPWMNHNMLLWPEQKEDVIRRLNDQAAMVMHV